VDNIREGGSTNIDSALKTAVGMVQDSSRPSYVLFLTDGLPTAGETRELTIAENCRSANGRRSRIFCFGVGFDVNARLLDRLSGGNSGTSEYVKPDEDIERHVASFYSKMTRPVLADIRVELAGVDVNRTYPRDIPDLFEGGQIVLAGRYRQSGRTTIRVTGKVAGGRRSMEFPAELAGSSSGSTYDFVERLWAVRRLGDLIDQIDMQGQNRELVDELVSLSTKYGILTPYTSFLADERVTLHASVANSAVARESLMELQQVTGRSAVAQRRFKQDLMKADRAGAEPRVAFEHRAGDADSFALSAPSPARPASPGGGLAASEAKGPLSKSRGAGGANGPIAGMGGMVGLGRTAGGGGRMMAGKLIDSKVGNGDNVAPTVRHIGSKTFYWKHERWIDSTVTQEEDEKAIVLTQLSDEYFRLARTQKAGNNQYLCLDEPVTVKLEGKVYRVEVPKKDAAQ
jgi:Ca-activated chloride channel family protein